MIGILVGVVLLGVVIVVVTLMSASPGKAEAANPNSTDARSSSYSGSLGKGKLSIQEAFGAKEASPLPPGERQVRFGRPSFANLSPNNLRRNPYGDGSNRNKERASIAMMQNWRDEND